MRNAIRAAALISLLLFAASLATCYFGVEHEIAKIPAEQRARMGDTDWIGVEWIGRAMLMQLAALAVAAAAGSTWIIKRKRTGATGVPR